jgi:hypothetical protein
VDSGTQTPSYAVDVQGETREITLRGNQIMEKRGAAGRIGIRIGPKVAEVVLEENEFIGFETSVMRER